MLLIYLGMLSLQELQIHKVDNLGPEARNYVPESTGTIDKSIPAFY